MRPLGLFSTIFLVAFVFMFFLIVFMNSYDGVVVPVMIETPEGGYIYSIESSASKDYFKVDSWEFHGKFPATLRRKARHLNKTRQVWILRGKGSSGSISISNLQYNRTAAEAEPVIVAIKYFITWGSGITVTGTGLNWETKQMEATEEKLVSAEGEATKTGLCRKLVYLGPVNEVDTNSRQ